MIKKIILIFPLVSLLACQQSATGDGDLGELDTSPEQLTQKRTKKIENIFFNVPTPVEITNILQLAGASYDLSLPNDPMKIDNYNTLAQKGVNLGIYAADLNYSSTFTQDTETMLYLKCASALGEDIGLGEIFDQRTRDRIEWNMDYPDSMKNIISETFWRVDNHLREEGRETVSALIILGGWIEGLHLATQMYVHHPENKQIRERIAEQKYSLDNLIGLLESFDKDEALNDHINSLYELKTLFGLIVEKKVDSEINPANNGSVIIGSTIFLEMSDEVLTRITTFIADFRSDLVN